MADLTSANVVITPQTNGMGNSKYRIEGNKRKVVCKVVFGNGALTYPANGVPMPAATSFGMYRNLDTLSILDQSNADGIVWKWDYANKKLRGYYSAATTTGAAVFSGSALAAHGHVLHLNDADVGDGATTRVNAGTNLLGANTGADLEIASVPDATGAGGIIQITAGTPAGTNTDVGKAAGSLVELAGGSYAVGNNTTLYVEAIGW